MRVQEDLDELLRRTADESPQGNIADLYSVPVNTVDEYKALNVWLRDKKMLKTLYVTHNLQRMKYCKFILMIIA